MNNRRKQEGWTVRKLARALGFSSSRLINIEKGRAKPDDKNYFINRVAALLNLWNEDRKTIIRLMG